MGDDCGGGQPAPARHRLHRHLLPSQGGPRHAARGDGAPLVDREIKRHAEARGISASQFAVAWVLNNALVTGTIAGPRTFEQWEHYLGALEYKFTSEDEALVDRLVAPGPPLNPRLQRSRLPPRGPGPAQRLTCWTPAPAMRARLTASSPWQPRGG
jgi:hypothetical protein